MIFGVASADAAVSLSPFRIYNDEITVLGSMAVLNSFGAAADLMAAGALQVLSEAGRAVPGDVAVVGFDDSPFAASTIPPLSSVMQPIEELGREMTRLLLAAIHSRDRVPRRVILATDLIVRASSGG